VKKTEGNRVTVRFDDKRYSRLMEMAIARRTTVTETLRDCFDGISIDLFQEVKKLQIENMQTQVALKKVEVVLQQMQQLLQNILPEITTRKEAIDNADSVGLFVKMLLEDQTKDIAKMLTQK
jgi:hypothetical protein